ncbi:DUF433 domain-containing protein [Candidatus Poribacteria bacterium]|nr:DUF433 domain-containing protein [Candidatus Poribacteria bacterium]
MTIITEKKKIKHPYIICKKDTCNGKPIIVGTRIKVSQIAIEYERMRMTPDEIIQAHPHLTLAKIHDALSYYYENVEEINADIRSGEGFVEEMKKDYPHSIMKDF